MKNKIVAILSSLLVLSCAQRGASDKTVTAPDAARPDSVQTAPPAAFSFGQETKDLLKRCLPGNSQAELLPLVRTQNAGHVKISTLLPQKTDFCFDLTITDYQEYLSMYREHLDTTGSLKKYESNLASLAKRAGKNPEEYFADLDIREIGVVRWEGRTVLLLRPGKPQVSHDRKWYQYAGFARTVFGPVFGIGEETSNICIGNWIVIGSPDSVSRFTANEKRIKDLSQWPSRSKAVVFDRKSGNTMMLTWKGEHPQITIQ